MPLLDGRYEILAERPLASGVVRFDATTAEGRPVRVVWYELASADEAAFERYRRALRALARVGAADVLDVVSRPGARYVAWASVDADLAEAKPPGEAVRERLAAVGLAPDRARVRAASPHDVLVDLPFGSDVAPAATAATSEPAPASSARRAGIVLSDAAVSWTISLVVTLVALALAVGGFALRSNDRLVRIPDLPGLGATEVAERLVALGLRVEPVPQVSSEAVGSVLALDPNVGTAVRPGRSVRLSYAVPPGRLAPASVPAVLGLTLVDAERRLGEVGLEPGRLVRVHEESPAGVVLAQQPPSGSTVEVGSGIDLVLSLGPAPVMTFVPSLLGRSLDEARELAAVAGVVGDALVVERVEARDAAPGTVVSQSLPAYRRVPLEGSVLRLLVAEGTAVSDEPIRGAGLADLTGLSEADARELATGFDVQVSYLYDRALPDGVVWQTPGPGSDVTGGVLRLGVNERPVTIPRPRVDAVVRRPQLREVAYLWVIEPGIPTQTAEVTATTLAGDREVVRTVSVRGGERVEGTWWTTYAGPVRFALTLNGEPYGGELLIP